MIDLLFVCVCRVGVVVVVIVIVVDAIVVRVIVVLGYYNSMTLLRVESITTDILSDNTLFR